MTAPFESTQIDIARETPEDKHPAVLYLAQLGPGSKRTMTEALQKIARYLSDGRCDMYSLPWAALRIEHTSALRTRLASELAPATANKHLAALRGVLKHVWRLGQISAEDHQRAIDLPAVRGPAPRKSRALSQEELRALVGACERDRSPAGPRDAALFALLFGAGLRRAEVAALDLSDFDRRTSTICVRGNGTKPPRRFTANREGLLALEGWLARRGVAPGPLFNPVNKGGRIEIRRLSEQAIYVACHKRAAEAGLPPVSPEDLRRSLLATKPRRDAANQTAATNPAVETSTTPQATAPTHSSTTIPGTSGGGGIGAIHTA
ncbi:MAG: tyrosine-type recombinase/integrase [Myxococcota bacterium]|jgi:integrase|nr:tyrosine-type recombinase/integrase [Myxococcota bacterium]